MEEDPYCCDSCWIKIVTASVICMVNACYQNSQFTLSFQPIYNLYLVQDGCDIDNINVWISNINVSMAKPRYITHLNHVRVQMVNWCLLLVQVAVWVKKLFGALCCFWEGCVFCHSAALLQNLKDLPSFSPAADHLVAWNHLCLVRKYTKEYVFCQFLIQWVSDYMDTWITHE